MINQTMPTKNKENHRFPMIFLWCSFDVLWFFLCFSYSRWSCEIAFGKASPYGLRDALVATECPRSHNWGHCKHRNRSSIFEFFWIFCQLQILTLAPFFGLSICLTSRRLLGHQFGPTDGCLTSRSKPGVLRKLEEEHDFPLWYLEVP